jgi:pimeloyl-ACP methyl ester carboxylesterase
MYSILDICDCKAQQTPCQECCTSYAVILELDRAQATMRARTCRVSVRVGYCRLGWRQSPARARQPGGVLDPLPPDVDAFLGGAYGEVSPHGPEHWRSVWPRLEAEHHRSPALTTADLAAIDTPTLLMSADNASEVTVDHLHAMHRALPHAQLAIVPGTTHGLPADKPLNRLVIDFLTEDAK